LSATFAKPDHFCIALATPLLLFGFVLVVSLGGIPSALSANCAAARPAALVLAVMASQLMLSMLSQAL
jgi:hypothetical protein